MYVRVCVGGGGGWRGGVRGWSSFAVLSRGRPPCLSLPAHSCQVSSGLSGTGSGVGAAHAGVSYGPSQALQVDSGGGTEAGLGERERAGQVMWGRRTGTAAGPTRPRRGLSLRLPPKQSLEEGSGVEGLAPTSRPARSSKGGAMHSSSTSTSTPRTRDQDVHLDFRVTALVRAYVSLLPSLLCLL